MTVLREHSPPSGVTPSRIAAMTAAFASEIRTERLVEEPASRLAPILLVDDESAVLDGLRRQLHKKFDVHTATDGAAALELLEEKPITVVVSDMRMPEMDGATLLAQIRSKHPNVVGLLLTGHADTQAAIAAVNEGNIFRFLTKPCPADVLAGEIDAAVDLSRSISAEKELLAMTLRRTVEALIATLSLAQPAAFAQAQRVTRTVTELAGRLAIEESWEVGITAMLAFLGAVALPSQVLTKMDAGQHLDEGEQRMVARVPVLSHDLVVAIPRLDRIAQAIGWQGVRFDGVGAPLDAPTGEDLPLVTRILQVALAFDQGVTQRPLMEDALKGLQADSGAFDPQIVEALFEVHRGAEPVTVPRVVGVADMREGMIMWEDVRTSEGVLLVGRGTVVTASLIQRLESYIVQDRAHEHHRVVC